MARFGQGPVSPAFFAASATLALCAVGLSIFSMTQAHEVTIAAGLARSIWAFVISSSLLALYVASALHSGVDKRFSESLGAKLGIVFAAALLSVFPVAASVHHSLWSWREPWSTVSFGLTFWAVVFAVPSAPSVYTRSYPKWPVSLAVGSLLGIYLVYRGLSIAGRLR